MRGRENVECLKLTCNKRSIIGSTMHRLDIFVVIMKVLDKLGRLIVLVGAQPQLPTRATPK